MSLHRPSRVIAKSAIPPWQVAEHARLVATVEDLFFDLNLRSRENAISGLLLVSARRFLADTYRLISREPHARALLRLPPGPEIAMTGLLAALRDAQTGLAAFQRDHSDDDSERDDFWLVRQPDKRTY